MWVKNLVWKSEESNKWYLVVFCNLVCADGVRSKIANSQMEELVYMYFTQRNVFNLKYK